ncbi:MAG: hypothetical protein K2X38_13215 [Gemmataceae bacterium]|nr:hypothetical protein [Gemmataceae bacterium]
MSRFDVALLTEDRYESPDESDPYVARLTHEDALVRRALENRGLRVARLSWSSPNFDWSQTACSVFRSTWDYFYRIGEFSRWLDHAAGQTQLINDVSLIRWNLDKHYLLDLQRSGVAIPRTHIMEIGDPSSLASAFAQTGWTEAVLKPAISGAGRHTYRLSPSNVDAHESIYRQLIETEAMLVQEFRPEIVDAGETSLIFIGGRFSHAVRKTAKPGEFRVQDDHGGVAHPHQPGADEIAFAEQALAACSSSPMYARVDVLRTGDDGWLLMELELIEPELFFRFRPEAADELAAAVSARLRG